MQIVTKKIKSLLCVMLSMIVVIGMLQMSSVVAKAGDYPAMPETGDSILDRMTNSHSDTEVKTYIIPKEECIDGTWTDDLKVYYVKDASSGQYGTLFWWTAPNKWSSDTTQFATEELLFNNLKGNTKATLDLDIAGANAFEWIPRPTSVTTERSSHVHIFEKGIIKEPSCESDGLEGTYCKICGYVIESSPLSALGYVLHNYASPMIDSAKAGQTVTFEMGELNSFPEWFMGKIAQRNDVTFVFKYKWNHEQQEIVIPAGTEVDLNFEWYGPAKMKELYGGYTLF